MTEREKMLAGELYRPDDPELTAARMRAESLLLTYNATRPDEDARRTRLLRDLFGAVGDATVVRPPFHCDYGTNIRVGDHVFVNFGCVFLDVAAIEIGDWCQIGPGVHVYAADHPREPALRRGGFELGRPVRVGNSVWIGGGALLLPGVTIGDDAIVGAGSVVTRDVPAGATVVGNPARPQ